MRAIDAAVKAALEDPEIPAGIFLAISVAVDGLTLVERYSNQIGAVTLGSDSFRGGNLLASFKPPARMNVGAGGGRGGGARVVDRQGILFDLLRDTPVADTAITVDLSFLTAGGWSAGYRFYEGHVGEAALDLTTDWSS